MFILVAIAHVAFIELIWVKGRFIFFNHVISSLLGNNTGDYTKLTIVCTALCHVKYPLENPGCI